MAKLSKQEQEWGRMFDNSTNPQEIMELALKLGMGPFTLQEATEAAERHARIIARRTEPDEPEKGYLNLLLKLVDVEDEAEREAIYDKIAEHEMRRMQEEEQKKNEVLQDLLARWGDTTDRQEFIKLGLILDPKATEEEMSSMFDQVWSGYQSKKADRMDEVKKEKLRALWHKFFATEDRQEQEAILQEIYDGTLTTEELEAFFAKD